MKRSSRLEEKRGYSWKLVPEVPENFEELSNDKLEDMFCPRVTLTKEEFNYLDVKNELGVSLNVSGVRHRGKELRALVSCHSGRCLYNMLPGGLEWEIWLADYPRSVVCINSPKWAQVFESKHPFELIKLTAAQWRACGVRSLDTSRHYVRVTDRCEHHGGTELVYVPTTTTYVVPGSDHDVEAAEEMPPRKRPRSWFGPVQVDAALPAVHKWDVLNACCDFFGILDRDMLLNDNAQKSETTVDSPHRRFCLFDTDNFRTLQATKNLLTSFGTSRIVLHVTKSPENTLDDYGKILRLLGGDVATSVASASEKTSDTTTSAVDLTTRLLVHQILERVEENCSKLPTLCQSLEKLLDELPPRLGCETFDDDQDEGLQAEANDWKQDHSASDNESDLSSNSGCEQNSDENLSDSSNYSESEDSAGLNLDRKPWNQTIDLGSELYKRHFGMGVVGSCTHSHKRKLQMNQQQAQMHMIFALSKVLHAPCTDMLRPRFGVTTVLHGLDIHLDTQSDAFVYPPESALGSKWIKQENDGRLQGRDLSTVMLRWEAKHLELVIKWCDGELSASDVDLFDFQAINLQVGDYITFDEQTWCAAEGRIEADSFMRDVLSDKAQREYLDLHNLCRATTKALDMLLPLLRRDFCVDVATPISDDDAHVFSFFSLSSISSAKQEALGRFYAAAVRELRDVPTACDAQGSSDVDA